MSLVIQNDDQHRSALTRLEYLLDKQVLEVVESYEVVALGHLIDEYETMRYPIDPPDPIDAIRFRMEQQDLQRSDMVDYFGSMSAVHQVLDRQEPMTLDMIRKLHNGLGISSEILIREYPIQEGTGHADEGN